MSLGWVHLDFLTKLKDEKRVIISPAHAKIERTVEIDIRLALAPSSLMAT